MSAQTKAAAVKTYQSTTQDVETTNLLDDPVGIRLMAQSGSANDVTTAGSSGPCSAVTGVTGATSDQSCEVQIAEPFIPFVETRINGVNNTDGGGGGSGNKRSFWGASQHPAGLMAWGVCVGLLYDK